jgi:effector-binding domain-containing protein
LLTATQPRIEERNERPCVAIPVTAALREWNNAIDQIPVLFEWLDANGVTPAGPLYFRYRVIGSMDEPFEIEVGIPVLETAESSGPVMAGVIPGGAYATVVHRGHPDGIVNTCEKLETWAADQGIEFAVEHRQDKDIWAGRFEFYLTDPDVEPDRSKWETEIAYLTRNG